MAIICREQETDPGQEKRWRTENANILKTVRKRYDINKERVAKSQRAYVQKNKEQVSNSVQDNTVKVTGNG